MGQVGILVVDDSPITVKKLTNMLRELGYGVVGTASTGAEALTVYDSCNPDLVTMDITMPGLDGITATERIMHRYPRALIVMVTSHGQEEMVLDAMKAGAKGYILKPFQKDKLHEVIEEVVKRYAHSDGVRC